MKMKKKTKRAKKRISLARLPLPKKGKKRHGDRTKYARPREKERLRHELDR